MPRIQNHKYRIRVEDFGYGYDKSCVRVRGVKTLGDRIYFSRGVGQVVQGAFVATLALTFSLANSGFVLLASAVEPDIVEGHVVNVVAKIEPTPIPEPEPEEQVVLNEILPNPEGFDTQDGLAGEWVELYNLGGSEVDLAGWYIKDGSTSGNTQIISLLNTHTGETVIGPNGSGSEWLVVFMDAAVLNNMGDTVFLFDNEDSPKDNHAFGSSTNDTDDDTNTTEGEGNEEPPSGTETAGNEGKSIARIPDGTGAWVDPIPTPGGPNRLEAVIESEQPEVQAEVVEETVPAITGGGGAVGSIAGPPAGGETPVEPPAETEAPAVVEELPPAETPAEAPIETPAETEEPPAVLEEPPATIEEPPAVIEDPPAPEEPPAE